MTAGGITIAFDIYGTLADTSGVARALAGYSKDAKDAAAFAARWRDKQLEYTFRRTAMGCYADFGQCTAEALLFVCAERGIKLDDAQRRQLSAEYSRLPLFPDAKPALDRLRQSGNVKMFAFSNGKEAAVKEWLKRRGIADDFARIVSADEVKMFKPAPRVYRHFLQCAKRNVKKTKDTYLVSGNPFDIIGAQHTGIKGIWLNRTGKAVFDPWQGVKPARTLSSLDALADMFC